MESKTMKTLNLFTKKLASRLNSDDIRIWKALELIIYIADHHTESTYDQLELARRILEERNEEKVAALGICARLYLKNT